MNADPDYALDLARVRRGFDRAGATYDDAAVLQAEVRRELLHRLELTVLDPRCVLDAGAGTGHASRELRRRYPAARVVAVDAAFGMLRAARRQRHWLRGFDRVCADAERLPLRDGCVDLIVSNLLLPWCDPDRLFAEFRRVLAPQGYLCFSSLGPDTLRELRTAWQPADGQSHVHRFIDMHDVGDALVRAGFADPVLDVDRYTLYYTDLRALARDLRAVGARNHTRGRPRGLTGRRRFAAIEAAYELSRRDGRLPATYEVVFGQAWAPRPGGRRRDDGTVGVPLDVLKDDLRQRRKA